MMLLIYSSALFAVLVLSNFSTPIPLTFFDAQRLVVVLLISFSVLCFGLREFLISSCSKNSQSVLSAKSIVLFFVFSAALVLISLIALNPITALSESLLLVVSLLASIAFSTAFRAQPLKLAKTLLFGVLLTFLVYYFQFLIGFFAGLVAGTSIEREVLIHHFSNIRFVNHLQVLSTPLLIFLALTSTIRSVRYASFSVAGIGVSVLLFCSARAATGCLLIAFVIGIAVFRFDRGFVKTACTVVLSGIVFYALIFKLIPIYVFGSEVVDLQVKVDSSGRWDLWVESSYLIRENWLVGIGPQHYSYFSNYSFAHPHNLVLQFALDYGVILTALLFIGLLLFGLRIVRVVRAYDNYGFEKACAWSLLSIFGTSLFSGVWVVPMTQLLIVLIAAPLIAVVCSKPFDIFATTDDQNDVEFPKKLVRSSTCFNRFLSLLMITFAIFFAFLIAKQAEQRINEPITIGSENIKMIYAPRFWQYQHWNLDEL